MTETLLIFQKSYDGKAVDSILAHGAGALNVDGGRIGVRNKNESGWSKTGSKASENRAMSGANYARTPKSEIGIGRWPANLLLSHSQLCGETCHAECPVRELDEQSGISKSPNISKNYGKHNLRPQPGANGTTGKGWNGDKIINGFGDTGGASRFFTKPTGITKPPRKLIKRRR